MRSRTQTRTGGSRAWTSRPEAHHVVQDMTDEKAPPDDESQDRGQGGPRSSALVDKRPPPGGPIGRQQAQAYGDKILLEVEEAQRTPMAVPLHIGLDVDFEAQVDHGAEQRGGH